MHVRLTATFIWLQVVKSIPSNVPINTLLVNLLQIVCCMVSSFNSLQITGIEGSSFLKGLLLALPSPLSPTLSLLFSFIESTNSWIKLICREETVLYNLANLAMQLFAKIIYLTLCSSGKGATLLAVLEIFLI